MVDIRYIPLTPLQKMPASGFSSWILLLLIIVSFTGCATSTTASRIPAKVEDRTLPQEQLPQEQIKKPGETPVPAPEPQYQPAEPVIEPQVVETPVEKPAEQKTGPAVVALLDDADQYVASGKKQQAVASIERALRIEPKNPVLWHKLGEIRLQEGQWDQAIAMAKKSNVLAPGNKILQSDNWLIIAKAREATGDKEGALQALDMMQQLRN